jgi:hypothetical protein
LANEYKTPPVYMPAQTGLMHHAPRDREIDPDAKGHDRTVAKSTEAGPAVTVRRMEEGGETGAKTGDSDSKPDLGPKTDPANLVRAQEIAGDKDMAQTAVDRQRAAVASAAEMVGAPEELKRLDENRDGRIDQLEVQHALRAKGDDSTYAALSHYQKTLGFGPGGDKSDKEADKSEKLFAAEIAEAEKAKLLEKQAGGDTGADGEAQGEVDSSEPVVKSDPAVKIIV